MRADDSVLVLVDYQERLMPAINDGAEVVRRAGFLAEVAGHLRVPVVGTAQNPSRLGPNDPAIHDRCQRVVEKMTFGAGGVVDEVLVHLDARPDHLREVVIAGCETHVCLLQTALALLESGRRAWVVADACGSRHPLDHEAALARLRAAGAVIVTAEMVAFEWLETAEHESFKPVSRLVKDL